MKQVRVHIDRLLLKGVSHDDRHSVAQGLQQELRRVLADREAVSVLKGRGEIARLRVAGVDMDSSAGPRHLGERVAQGIGREIRK